MRRSLAPSKLAEQKKVAVEADLALKLGQGIDPFPEIEAEGRSLRKRAGAVNSEPSQPRREYIDVTGKKRKRSIKKKDESDEEEEPELEPDDEEANKEDGEKENDRPENPPMRREFDDAFETSENGDGMKVVKEESEKKYDPDQKFFEVQWWEKKGAERKAQQGILSVKKNVAVLYHRKNGRPSTECKEVKIEIKEGMFVKMNLREIDVGPEVTADSFYSGTVFLKKKSTYDFTKVVEVADPNAKPLPLYMQNSKKLAVNSNNAKSMLKKVGTGFQVPYVGGTRAPVDITIPKFDPKAPDAIVLYKPLSALDRHNKRLVPVVLDPLVAATLRPHQKEGVQFLYDCMIGQKVNDLMCYGCILADEMGLGKTIQSVTLTYTLLHQGMHGTPTVQKAIIVSPSSLVKNWCKEFEKWLKHIQPPPAKKKIKGEGRIKFEGRGKKKDDDDDGAKPKRPRSRKIKRVTAKDALKKQKGVKPADKRRKKEESEDEEEDDEDEEEKEKEDEEEEEEEEEDEEEEEKEDEEEDTKKDSKEVATPKEVENKESEKPKPVPPPPKENTSSPSSAVAPSAPPPESSIPSSSARTAPPLAKEKPAPPKPSTQQKVAASPAPDSSSEDDDFVRKPKKPSPPVVPAAAKPKGRGRPRKRDASAPAAVTIVIDDEGDNPAVLSPKPKAAASAKSAAAAKKAKDELEDEVLVQSGSEERQPKTPAISSPPPAPSIPKDAEPAKVVAAPPVPPAAKPSTPPASPQSSKPAAPTGSNTALPTPPAVVAPPPTKPKSRGFVVPMRTAPAPMESAPKPAPAKRKFVEPLDDDGEDPEVRAARLEREAAEAEAAENNLPPPPPKPKPKPLPTFVRRTREQIAEDKKKVAPPPPPPFCPRVVAIADSSKNTGSVLWRMAQARENPMAADVLCISYDQFRIHEKKILANPYVDLLICDEGHRIKNDKIKITKALDSLKTKRRIILSGTPIQNDLDEFYAMVNFVNPGVLGDPEVFRRVYSEPITRGRDPTATAEEREEGRQRSEALSQMTARFILRRTADINQKYLPNKEEFVVFCKLTDVQQKIYQGICDTMKLMRAQGAEKNSAAGKHTLRGITALKKLCNHPELIWQMYNESGKDGELAEGKEFLESVSSHLLALYGPGATAGKKSSSARAELSGKMQFVDNLLQEMKRSTDDRIVIVSNYTETLDVLQRLCNERNIQYFRLDGKTVVNKRQTLVDEFSTDKSKTVFFLSSKAGGVGLNLVGANRLVLFDPDWNPALDLQAMARVWRDGQKKQVYIYRLFSTGTIEEKIFQRQVTKQGLSNSIVDSKTTVEALFTGDDLKNLFTYISATKSETHDLIGCLKCKGEGKVSRAELFQKRKKNGMEKLENWTHHQTMAEVSDKVLKVAAGDIVTYAFSNFEAGKYVSPEEAAKTVKALEAGSAASADLTLVEKPKEKEKEKEEKEKPKDKASKKKM